MAAHTVVLLAIWLFLPLNKVPFLCFILRVPTKVFQVGVLFTQASQTMITSTLINATSYSSASLTQIKHEDRTVHPSIPSDCVPMFMLQQDGHHFSMKST